MCIRTVAFKMKIFLNLFAGLKNYSTFAIPIQSGCGEMVDALL